MADPVTIKPYEGPSGGWGSARSLTEILLREQVPLSGGALLMHQNKPDGFMCVSCAWAKPGKPAVFEYCENGAKATAWEVTRRRITADFFAKHTVTELESWRDYDLEELGRLTEPMRWDAATDRYVPVSWEDAFGEIGAELQAADPKSTVFYASGRASLEASYMYGLLARLYGNNNLPDSSNMCHESTSVALPESIGSPVGTVLLDDFEHTDCIFFFGQNPGSNAPRMLHPLQDASKRGVPIITFNPFRERGLERFTNPQSPVEMLTRSETRITSQYLQVKAGGDLGALYGLCKALIEADDAAAANGSARLIDTAFIAQHTHGFEAFAESVRGTTWETIEAQSGLPRRELEQAARTYARAKATMGIYGMGLTQHRKGVETVQMLVNLLLLRGNIGRPGAGICPVRGHSNVQGQRTVGITEKPELVPGDTLKALYGFEPPKEKGLNTVEACEGILDGSVRAFVALGGNFIRAVPETVLMEAAWRKLRLTVQVSTKLNRNHLIHGEIAYILPCLGRIEIDAQPGGRQAVAMEDSTACIHGSKGYAEPASPQLLSEPRIVAGIAKATLAPNPSIDWDRWGSDYASVRDAIEATYPSEFKDFNARMWQPGGFRRPIPAAERVWKTETGKANFVTPQGLSADPDTEQADPAVLRLITMRSNDQFNTTIYGYDDRFRGVKGTRMVLFMNRTDIARLGLRDAQTVSLIGAASDGVERRVDGFRVLAYDVPVGCVGGYYPECNPLIPLWHHAERSKVPAAKSVPVRILAP
ncbi:FdhF/YdeP family oxidoreductase [Methylobacterium planeticum]|uniref:FdhF/YdeP family oxidoreductase n=1 Tax=Methylobacterium planeticum TaxID=2615211 RepID=A0A6N6MTY5_9HYPH|nr:FdhF/YdeP family oxidoreductase [Methylobacterium planeticum]KAB1073975.1 FdhF/YdeP family oxidoreductase [Methylobacterium planeticum]